MKIKLKHNKKNKVQNKNHINNLFKYLVRLSKKSFNNFNINTLLKFILFKNNLI